tara:strand:- start:631 stop:1089 length:459 start_codon:yes stop_codon:yes gene_type:complete
MYTVTRQMYWPDGQHVVEVQGAGRDGIGSDMLVEHYPGESMDGYADPREAAAMAVKVLLAWRADGTDASIDYGNTWGGSLPLTEETTAMEVLEWAQREYDELPKCDRCGELITDDPWHIIDFADDAQYCGENCADLAYEDIMLDIISEGVDN